MKNERRILSGTEENPITVAETRWKDDGSRVESFQDYRTGAAHFAVYNAQGELVESVHGHFDTPKKPEPSEQTQSEWMPDEPPQTAQNVREPARQHSQIPSEPTTPARLPEKKAPLEVSRPLAASAAVLCALQQLLSFMGSFLSAINESRYQTFGYGTHTVMEYFVDSTVQKLPAVLLAVIMIAALVRFRKDWFMGAALIMQALWNLRYFVLTVAQFMRFPEYSVAWMAILSVALNLVMAVDCFRALRMPVRVRWLLFGGGGVLLAILNAAEDAFRWYQLCSDLEEAVKLIFFSSIPALIGAIPGILLGFALAGAKPMGDRENRGYVSMGVHVVLALFVSRIWSLVWVYRTSRLLRQDAGDSSPVAQLLLFLFVPFYSIAWYYDHAKRVNERAVSMGLPGDDSLGTVCLLCGIFLPLVSMILIQNKVNRAAEAHGN